MTDLNTFYVQYRSLNDSSWFNAPTKFNNEAQAIKRAEELKEALPAIQ